jgi:hypothetical protein
MTFIGSHTLTRVNVRKDVGCIESLFTRRSGAQENLGGGPFIRLRVVESYLNFFVSERPEKEGDEGWMPFVTWNQHGPPCLGVWI